MEYQMEYSEELISSFGLWKKLNYDNKWNKAPLIVKLFLLEELINTLWYYQEDTVNPTRVLLGDYYCYNPRTRTIFFDKNHASIISALHELGHHLFGPNELEACRWSIQLYAKIFPKEFSKLKWNGHMLIKSHGQN